MKTIYKYPIQIANEQYIEIPWGYKILSFQNKDNEMFIWVEVEEEHAKNEVKFNIVGTGHKVPIGEYIGTVVMPDGFVWHLYKRLGY